MQIDVGFPPCRDKTENFNTDESQISLSWMRQLEGAMVGELVRIPSTCMLGAEVVVVIQ